jgi:hypothetical protein
MNRKIRKWYPKSRYNPKTGLFKGEESFSTSDRFCRDWQGRPIESTKKNYGVGKNGWDD